MADKVLNYFNDDLANLVYHRTYSRWNETEERRETWPETVDRLVDFYGKVAKGALELSEYKMIREAILNHKAYPSMRLLWSAGESVEKNNVAAYNCAYHPICRVDSFATTLMILLGGTGVGYSVEHKYIDELPVIEPRKKDSGTITVIFEDSKKGWAFGFNEVLQRMWEGHDVNWDLSKIRPRGSVLKTSGGRASGPEPLNDLLKFTKRLIESHRGRKLSPLNAHDLMCQIATSVVVGGSRRSAMISLSDLEDHKMARCKSGAFWESPDTIARGMANNSAVYTEKPTSLEFLREWTILAESGTGERGIYSRVGALNTLPARRKKNYEWGTNPCVTGDTLVAVADGRGFVPIKELAEADVDVPVYCTSDKGQTVIRTMRQPRMTRAKAEILKITLDDGSVVRATPNHKFMLRNGEYVRADELKANDSLKIMSRSLKKVPWSKHCPYYFVSGASKNHYAMQEHRMIVRDILGQDVPDGYQVHHIDFDSTNNSPDNLQVLSREDHMAIHRDHMLGDKNPMVRIKADKERYDAYCQMRSEEASGEGNPRYSGHSEDDIRYHALKLCDHLGRRFSNKEWLSYAKENGLPQSFTGWRKEQIGGNPTVLSKWAASHLGYSTIDADTRTLRLYQDLLSQGYNCDFVKNQIMVSKECSHCKNEYSVHHSRRATAFCSQECFIASGWNFSEKLRVENKAMAHENKRLALKEQQLDCFVGLKFKLGRVPMKKEWVAECKSNGISAEMCRKSSPFISYKAMQQAANDFNHRVVSVEAAGTEDVYCGTVDDFHNFFIGGFDTDNHGDSVLSKKTSVCVQNCAEITLRGRNLEDENDIGGQFCNLTTVIVRSDDTLDSLKYKVRIATIMGTIQSCLTHFPELDELSSGSWTKNTEEERLLGVSITGQQDAPHLMTAENLKELRKVSIATNEEYASRLRIPKSASVTTTKPEGTASIISSSASGQHCRFAPFYIRRVRISGTDPLYKMMRDQGVKFYPEVGMTEQDATIWVCEFPVKSPEGAVCADQMTAIQQLQYWLRVKKNYAEHSVSATIYVKEDEWMTVGNWVYEHFDQITGLSFLPYSDHIFQLAPMEEITESKYYEMLDQVVEIDYSKLAEYEREDMTTGAQQLACVAGQCEI